MVVPEFPASNFRRLLFAAFALVSVGGGLSMSVGAEEDPAGHWVSAYGWLKTGERLAEAELWPLALGSFIESHRQVRDLREAYPDFEPEMISYRLERLVEQIDIAREGLEPGEHEIMRKYVDFIDSFEHGLELRFSNDYAKALDTLDIAKVLLDEIIRENPDDFQEAVETQYHLLQDSIVWLDQQINYRQRSRPSVYVGDGVNWGTTEFVSQSDLPGGGETVFTEAALFPGGGVGVGITGEGAPGPADGADETEPAAGGESDSSASTHDSPLGFRMSSRQKTIPELPDEAAGEEENSE